MPKVTKTGAFHLHNGATAVATYNLQRYMDGRPTALYGLVYDNKADKHLVGSSWPAPQGGKHTGIMPDDAKHADRLYEEFTRDFALEFVKAGKHATWMELEYDESELPGFQYGFFGGDVQNKDFFRASKVVVGASVGMDHHGVWVHINHGPYAK